MNAASTDLSEGFTVVNHSKKKKKKGNTHLLNEKFSPIDLKSLPTSIDMKKIHQLQKDFEISAFFEEFKESLCSILKNWNPVQGNNDELHEKMSSLFISKSKNPIDIVCYGLGSFGSCLIARYQLVFLIALRDFLNVENVYVYDPVFSNDELFLLKELKFNILRTNEEAKRTVTLRTIFFMPHCDLPLYNNLLWSNWNLINLSKIIIIGNSFSGYSQSPKGDLKCRAVYMHFANQFVTEVNILNNYVFLDIFNNLSLHYFKNEAMSQVSDQIWLKTEEPVYQPEDSIKYF